MRKLRRLSHVDLEFTDGSDDLCPKVYDAAGFEANKTYGLLAAYSRVRMRHIPELRALLAAS
jgi:hypothetical protein